MGSVRSKIKAVNPLEFGGINLNQQIVNITNLKYDPDEKWSNLYREREKNHLYKWVGVNTGGEMLEVFENDGQSGIQTFVDEKVLSMLYNDGEEPQWIKLNDFLKWKKAQSTNLGGGKDEIVPGDALDGSDSGFQEHWAQWRLNKRGIEGETIVHLLFNREDPQATELGKVLIKFYPGLAKDIYLGDDTFGQTILHLAITKDDYETVQLLMGIGVDVNARATGKFFLPEDQQLAKPKKNTNYIGFAYYGEYPLAFAACFGNKDIYDLLLNYGADPNLQDSFGNTVLHMCVINNSIDIYAYAVRHWQKPADVNIVNLAGYTPLTLASRMGRKDIFEQMLELMKVEFWRFSDMAFSLYPLTTLDTIKADGSTNWDSALMIIINGNTPEHLDMIGNEVVQRLLADKWKAYGFKKFIQRLALVVVQLFFLSIAVYLRPSNRRHLMYIETTKDYFRLPCEFLVVVGCLYFMIGQQFSEIRTQGLWGYFKNLKTAPAKAIYLLASIFIILCIPCRIMSSTHIHFPYEGFWVDLEKFLLCFAIPGSWFFLLFFARGIMLTGPFVQMIYSMIVGDIAVFAIISIIFIGTFTQVFYFTGKDIQKHGNCKVNHKVYSFDSFLETFMTLIRACMEGYDYEEFHCVRYETFTKVVFVFYMFCMPIMMINLLIAMMGNTYQKVISKAEKAWRQQWAQIIMVLERSIKKQILSKHQIDYSIKLGANKEGGEIRGLMVVKQTKKTKAKQRKQAISNWKRIGHRVILAIEQLGRGQAKKRLHAHGSNAEIVVVTERKRAHKEAKKPEPVMKGNFLLSVPLNQSPAPEIAASPSLIVHRTQTPAHHPPGALPSPTEIQERDVEQILQEVGDLSAPSSIDSAKQDTKYLG